jgi:hypothetical protein
MLLQDEKRNNLCDKWKEAAIVYFRYYFCTFLEGLRSPKGNLCWDSCFREQDPNEPAYYRMWYKIHNFLTSDSVFLVKSVRHLKVGRY